MFQIHTRVSMCTFLRTWVIVYMFYWLSQGIVLKSQQLKPVLSCRMTMGGLSPLACPKTADGSTWHSPVSLRPSLSATSGVCTHTMPHDFSSGR